MILPPTRSRASVTSTSPRPCRVASACAVHSPLIPPPTTTHSTVSRPPAAASASPPATARSLATEHRIQRRAHWPPGGLAKKGSAAAVERVKAAVAIRIRRELTSEDGSDLVLSDTWPQDSLLSHNLMTRYLRTGNALSFVLVQVITFLPRKRKKKYLSNKIMKSFI